jgi:predicted ABC-type sugar transport system permease subunit
MAAAILLGALVGVLGGVVLSRALRPKRALSPAQQTLLRDAAALLADIRTPTDLDRIDALSDQSKQATDRWLTRYRKESNR